MWEGQEKNNIKDFIVTYIYILMKKEDDQCDFVTWELQHQLM